MDVKKIFVLGVLPFVIIRVAESATISNVPSFVTSTAFSNVLIDMSVETPMGGAAYADQPNNPVGCPGRSIAGGGEVGSCYFSDYEYKGIFDNKKCYKYNNDQFEPDGMATNHRCDGKWSGNFLNWATMTAIDIFIWTMTGGDREIDDATQTVLRRARVTNNQSWYPIKYIANAAGAVPGGGAVYITNHDQGGYKFKLTRGGSDASYNVKVRVCDSAKGLESNCRGYTKNGITVYKPEGLIQRYSDKMRFGVFAYTLDGETRDGGVLRAPMRYVGSRLMNDNGSLADNTQKEINPETGQIIKNPLNYSGGWSGVINYINRFHRDGYKSSDPISEMYYEVIRYFKHLTPTPEYSSGANGGTFPIYTSWNDPIQFSCQKNFIIAINDSNPWYDKKLPGTFFTCDKAGKPGMPESFAPSGASDCGEPSNPDTSINVSELTQKVGAMEGLHTIWTQNDATGSDAVGYVYGVNSNVGNCNNGKSVAVSNLAEVMGTCPHAPKQNSYYIAGLAYYANITDLRPDLDGKQNVNSFFIDTQEYSPNPLSGNRNMLYLAGKYGGFVDKNDNNEPDLVSEWDADGDGQPDNFVTASDPDKLINGLQRAFSNVLAKTGSMSNVTANSTQVVSDSLVFQSIFNSSFWSGDVIAYPVTNSGVGATPVWKASNSLASYDNRNIWTKSGGNVTEFLWDSLSDVDKTAVGGEDIVNYIRGDRRKEERNGGRLRDRDPNNVLGDIIDSSPFYVKDTNTIYVGANDGMMHAFNASNGQELFAYIPSSLIGKLKYLSQQNYNHDYYVDGEIAVSSRAQTTGYNYLVAALGRGGKGLFALDVTDPTAFGSSSLLWEYFNLSDPDLGFMLGKPIIAKMNDGSTSVIVGNGYNSTSGKAVLYIFNLKSGSTLKIDTGAAGDNGMATPGVFDSDGNGTIDYIYAGDLKGNLWKFDVSSSNTNQWKSAFHAGSDPDPLFTAKDPSGNPQPITAPITVAVDDVAGDTNYGKRFVFFGTGSYFRTSDPSDTQIQSWYGLIDENATISGRSSLMARSVQTEGTVNGYPVRTFAEATAGDMAGKKGWYIDLKTAGGVAQGERIVTESKYYKLAEPTLIASSIIPVVDPCVPGGTGYVNAINPFTGGSLKLPFFDLNRNADYSDDMLGNKVIGSVDVGVGMPSAPVLVGDELVVGGSSGETKSLKINPGAPPLRGRISWREIILN